MTEDATRREFRLKLIVWGVSVLAILIDVLVISGLAFGTLAEPERASARTELLGHLVFGILVLVGATFILEFKSLDKRSDDLSKRLTALASENTLLAVLNLRHGNVLDKFDILMHNCRYLAIPEGAMNGVWLDLSKSIRRYYWATNSIPLDIIYKPEWRQPAIDAQAEAVRQGAEVKKVFFCGADEARSRPFRDEIRAQKRQNLSVRYCDRAKPAELISHEDKARLRSLDFGVFDGVCVLIWKVDEHGKPLGGEMIFDRKEIQHYEEVFTILYGAGSDVS